MIWIYRILFLPVFALSIPYILWHVKRRGGYKKDLNHKFGDIPDHGETATSIKRVWIQAVSVGEVKALKSLIETLSGDIGFEVILTTTTSTGYKIAKESYGEAVEGIYYFPLDFVSFSRKAWDRIRPDICLLMEGELWPEHIHRANKRKVPIILVNARLSDKTFKLYQRLGAVTRHIFQSLDLVMASSENNGERFQALGVSKDKIVSVGNLKCDIPIPSKLSEEEKSILTKELGLPTHSEAPDSIIVCGASTWNGEEAILARVCENLRKEGINLHMVITPRHAERRKEIERTLANFELSTHFRSRGKVTKDVQIAIADTTGELAKFIQISDIVFVGRSLPPHTGGQTPIEAAMLGKPVLFGPGMSNFRDIARGLLNSGIATQVEDEDALQHVIRELCLDPHLRIHQGLKVSAWLEENQGATERTYQLLKNFAQ
jgi:3-deoxy-D-manno-octulosonic-acid transferase